MEPSKNETNNDKAAEEAVDPQKEAWEKPAIVSFEPIRSAEGLNLNPGDGVSNRS